MKLRTKGAGGGVTGGAGLALETGAGTRALGAGGSAQDAQSAAASQAKLERDSSIDEAKPAWG
ncbi:MAG TPA: hypothetical protein VER96_36950 [Polyangiaceae bacterium]|nr:hypothetical protein [Polyangiaceae bacterium]